MPVALVVVGAVCPILVAVAWRRLRHLDRYIGVLDKEIGLLHGVPCFSRCRCPPSNSSRAAWNLSTCQPARWCFTRVIRPTGSPIERARLVVLGDRSPGHHARSGDGFGEIALLRRVPRTAMVRAATDLELQALTCDRFLPVVTGFPPSSREAGAEVEEMLDRFSPMNRTTIKIGQVSEAESACWLRL